MATAATVECARCGRPDAPALARPPLPGKLGAEIQQRVCAACWAEWQKVEVMVINELRLNFMDPAAQETLNRHMREFLFPGSGEESRPETG
ncbi:MAG TPA: oxidative damage protection protein [Thermoanaerobaculia bacterium]|jgi:Fe-S cluster biosynthesis and repair protein YggX|nr:oxidative damage protection protein [Thermoanaerobaculia bacterium]